MSVQTLCLINYNLPVMVGFLIDFTKQHWTSATHASANHLPIIQGTMGPYKVHICL